MEYQIIYRAAPGCREIQKTIVGKDDLLSLLRSWVREPIYRETIVVSIHEIRKSGTYGNGRRAKKLVVSKLIAEATAPAPQGKSLIEIL